MDITRSFGYGDANSPSARVGAAWRELGAHARAYHRDELEREIAALRQPPPQDGDGPQAWQWR